MTAIVHRTPGLIDIRAFTTMGMSAKVGDNPIGMFGTGLKYAIAVLVRAGARPVVWIGRDRYEFYCEATKFRDKEFQLVRMKRQKWSLTKPSTHDLPFTTEYGRNWKMWMAFRELEANTRDEGGETFVRDEVWSANASAAGIEGATTIVIEHEDYVKAWEDRDNIFLPEGLSVRAGSEGLQIIKEPGSHVFYRGMRAYDIQKPTLYTYNILASIELTEDRTLKYEFQIKEQLARHLLHSTDEELIKEIITCDDDLWEYNLEFPDWVTPGETFRRVANSRPRGMWSSVGSYYVKHDDRPIDDLTTLLNKHPRPWFVSDSGVVDANSKAVFSAPYKYPGRWAPLAELILKRLAFDEESVSRRNAGEPDLDEDLEAEDDEEFPEFNDM